MKIVAVLGMLISIMGCSSNPWVPDTTMGYPFDETKSRVVLYQMAGTRCRLEGNLRPVSADRELEVVGEMYGNYDSEKSQGGMIVKVDGYPVIGTSLRRGQHGLPDGRMIAESRHWIRGNAAVSVSAEGTVSGGRCIDMNIRIRDSVAQ